MLPSLKEPVQLKKDRKEMVAKVLQAMETESPRFQLNSHADPHSPRRSSTEPSTTDSANTSIRSRASGATTLNSKVTITDNIYMEESTTDEDASTDSSEPGDEDIDEDGYDCPPDEWETITK